LQATLQQRHDNDEVRRFKLCQKFADKWWALFCLSVFCSMVEFFLRV
jgi:hypothetical protein